MAKKARVLVTTIIDGRVFEPDHVIEVSSARIKALGGAIDASSEAVKYCLESLGQKVTKIDDDFIGPRKSAGAVKADSVEG